MLESIKNFFKRKSKKEELLDSSSDAAKERLHLVLMQDRANVSADFLDMMKQEIVDVIKKYIDLDEAGIDVILTNQINEDGTNGAPALYANIPIISIKNETKSEILKTQKKDSQTKKNIIQNIGKNTNIENNKEIKVNSNNKTENSLQENNTEKEEKTNNKSNENNKKVVKKVATSNSKNESETKVEKKSTTKGKTVKSKTTTSKK